VPDFILHDASDGSRFPCHDATFAVHDRIL
jgi:hypothetical protein